jgi:Protein of unknown function (DUF2911)
MFVRSLKIAAAVVALAATTAAAQKVVSTKMGGGGSPHETVEWSVGGAKITISYGRPFLKGRPLAKIDSAFDLTGKVWRTGADEATTLTTDKGLMFGGLMVPAGTYTLFTVPGATAWKLVVSKQTGQWGTEYHDDRDLGRADLKVEKLAKPAEQVTISVTEVGGSPTLNIDWGTTRATTPFMVH